MQERAHRGALNGFGFLVGRQIDAATLRRAYALAEDWQVPPLAVLLNTGWVQPADYVRRLGRLLHVPTIADVPTILDRPVDAAAITIVDATAQPPDDVRTAVDRLRSAGHRVMLGSDYILTPDLQSSAARCWLARATGRLARRHPEASACGRTWLWQKIAVVLILGAFIGMALIDTPLAYFAISLVAAIPFSFVVAQRLAILALVITDNGLQYRPADLRGSLPSDADLPICTVLVPLFGEAEVLPDLVAELCKFDYPIAKLDILIILEEVDQATRTAADALTLPPFIRVVVVPDSQPRTKPKAMNYALRHARGSFVAVYDAEDIPDPAQLRLVQAIFAAGPQNLGCVQARLNLHNRRASWFSRHFALEYTALFDGLLPALRAIRTPLMLGGTSNHFRRSMLEDLGAWDPYNVTEDADLGIRITRAGYEVAVLDSTTWEEAPETWRVWLPQRTRWIKGWMQTYLVHMRRPSHLLRDLGLWRFTMLQCLLGGFLLSSLMHPLFYILLAVEFTRGQPFQFGGTAFEAALWYMASFNLFAGFSAAMIAAAVTAARRKFYDLLFEVPFMPAYWLLISIAAYRAVWQLLTAPHLWEKTRHSARSRTPAKQEAPMRWQGNPSTSAKQ